MRENTEQRAYSSTWKKLVRAGVKTKDVADTGISKALTPIKNKLTGSNDVAKSLSSNFRINRKTIGIANKISELPDKPVGPMINKGVSFAIKNPITTAGNVAPVVPGVPTAVALSPIGSASLAAEVGLKKAVPSYKKVTESLGDGYSNSKVAKQIGKIPSINQMASNIKFKKKNFTLQEGHYTGPKDLEDIPGALEMTGKGAGLGGGVGAVVGKLIKDRSAIKDAWTGLKAGTVGGIIAKLILNHMHKPLKKAKFEEVDREIRTKFGMYRTSGITVGDSLYNRNKFDERYTINRPNVEEFKINFAIYEGKVTMYTFDLTDSELQKVNDSLDYYCKKYFAMEYSARVINQKLNSYAADILFTNHQVIGSFIQELSEKLNCRINLLNNEIRSVKLDRFRERTESSRNEEEEMSNEKNFSKCAGVTFRSGRFSNISKVSSLVGKNVALPALEFYLNYQLENELAGGYNKNIDSLRINNVFLVNRLKKLGYNAPSCYTISQDKKQADIQMGAFNGYLVITSYSKGNVDQDLKKVLKKFNSCRHERKGEASIYTYGIQDSNNKELDLILRGVMSLKDSYKINIYHNVGVLGKTLKYFSSLPNIEPLKRALKAKKIDQYEVVKKPSQDYITLDTSDSKKIFIHIPEDREYTQYDIEKYVRTNLRHVRVEQIYEKDSMVYVLRGNFTEPQVCDLIKAIITIDDCCGLIGEQ